MPLLPLFVLGAIVGSFLNVVIWRLPRGEKVTGRSYCPKCSVRLKWYNLLPLVSFAVQGGKCGNCANRISWQYPLVEFFTGVLFILAGLRFLLSYHPTLIGLIITSVHLLIISVLVAIFVIDLRHFYIPDSLLVISAGVLAVLYGLLNILGLAFPEYGLTLINTLPLNTIFLDGSLLERIAAGFVGFSLFAIIVLLTKGKGMGWGDVKLAAVLGFLLGVKALLFTLWIAFIMGAIVGLLLISLKKARFRSQIPFAPFLVGSALLIMLI